MAGVMVWMRPFLGQLGTSPSIPMPDSHYAGDFGAFPVGAPHAYGLTAEQLAEHKTDGHMDIYAARPGAILVAPVKVKGDAEIVGQTMDVAGSVTLQVSVMEAWPIDGPVLFPRIEDLPPLALPFSETERVEAIEIAGGRGWCRCRFSRRCRGSTRRGSAIWRASGTGSDRRAGGGAHRDVRRLAGIAEVDRVFHGPVRYRGRRSKGESR